LEFGCGGCAERLRKRVGEGFRCGLAVLLENMSFKFGCILLFSYLSIPKNGSKKVPKTST
jgi:hypothetical protein